MKISVNWRTWCIAVTLLGSCTSTTSSEAIDPILRGISPCSPPCWINIVPGQTRTDQAIAILEQEETNGRGDFILLPTEISWQMSDGQRLHIFSDSEGVISSITIVLDRTELEMVIEQFGEPEYLRAGEIDDGWYSVYIYYPQKGVAFRTAGQKMELSSTMIVGMAYFVAPTQDASLMLNNIHGIDKTADYLSAMQVWKGYGVIKP